MAEGGGEHSGPFLVLMSLKRQVRSACKRIAGSEPTSCKFVMLCSIMFAFHQKELRSNGSTGSIDKHGLDWQLDILVGKRETACSRGS